MIRHGSLVRAATLCLPLVSTAGVVVGETASGNGPHGPRITLQEAVERTQRGSFELLRAKEDVEMQRGAHQQALGLFDAFTFVDAEFSFLTQEMLRADLDPEVRRRVPVELGAVGNFRGGPGALDEAADGLIAGTPGIGSILFDECNEFQTIFVVDTSDGPITLCIDQAGNLDGVVLGVNLGTTVGNIISVVQTLFLIQLLGEDFVDQLDSDLRLDLDAAAGDLIRQAALDLRTTAAAFRFMRERLGALPEEKELLDLRFEWGVRKTFRNGTRVTASAALLGTEDNYVDKPLDPDLGDSLDPNTFTTSVGINLDLPLGKGRGRVATAGPERAAESVLRARKLLWTHSASMAVLTTVNAYWNLAATQERLAALSESLSTQDTVLKLTRNRVETEDLPGYELDRVLARRAEVGRQLAVARRAVLEARLELVSAMGDRVEQAETAPLAADELPRSGQIELDEEDVAERLGKVESLRLDLAASIEGARASRILKKAAEANLRRQVDLVMNASFGGFQESIDDRIYDLGGYSDAVSGIISGPSYGIGLRFVLPFGNNEARGRLLQAQAALARSEINERDLKRTIQLALDELMTSRRSRLSELDRLIETVGYFEQIVESSMVRYEIGDISLIDALTTEQQLTDARLALTDARRALANLEVQLLFELGELLVGSSEEELFDPEGLRLSPFVQVENLSTSGRG